ncbi:hypothetical protein IKE96_03985 [bacterium]|nr:hypothetical protein [bacterium]
MNLNGTFTNEFSLSFRGTSNYEVYSNGQKLDNGYILKTPEIKMIISIEIDNPFKDKYVKFNFKKNEQNTTDQYFYQNEGGFSVKIGTSEQSGDFKDFSDFINSLPSLDQVSSLDQDKKQSLELAYFVSDHQLTDEQLKQSLEDSFLYGESVDPNQKYNV